MNTDRPSVVSLLKPLMVFSGTWMLDVRNKKIYWWYTRIFQGIFIIFLLSLSVKLLQLIWIDANYKAIYSNVGILLSCIAISSKIFVYQWNRVPEMFQIILSEEEKIWLSMDEHFILHYQKKIKYSRKWNWCIILNSFGLGLALIVAGLASLFAPNQTMTKSEGEQIQEWLMYPIWLPFRERDHTAFVVVLNIIFAVIGTGLFAVSHMIFATLMIYSVAQLELMHIKIFKLKWTEFDEGGYGFLSLKEIFDVHNGLIQFIKKLNKSTRYVVFVDFLVNSFNVASVAAQFASVENSAEFLFILTYFAVLIMQVFSLGWLTNEIKVQVLIDKLEPTGNSLNTAHILYDLNWYHLNTHARKLLHLMILQAQKALVISIGPFGMMTNETALSTIKAAYSFLMLMQNYSQ